MNVVSRLGPAMVIALAFALGCGDDITELVLVLDTDMAVPAELESIDLNVRGPDGTNVVDQTLAFNLPGAPGLPLSLGLVLDGDMTGPLVVEATGTTVSGGVVVRSVSTDFVPNASRALPLRLNAVCVDVDCPEAGETCGDGGTCETNVVPGDALPNWTGDPADFGVVR